jgi:hypothetical protein
MTAALAPQDGRRILAKETASLAAKWPPVGLCDLEVISQKGNEEEGGEGRRKRRTRRIRKGKRENARRKKEKEDEEEEKDTEDTEEDLVPVFSFSSFFCLFVRLPAAASAVFQMAAASDPESKSKTLHKSMLTIIEDLK